MLHLFAWLVGLQPSFSSCNLDKCLQGNRSGVDKNLNVRDWLHFARGIQEIHAWPAPTASICPCSRWHTTPTHVISSCTFLMCLYCIMHDAFLKNQVTKQQLRCFGSWSCGGGTYVAICEWCDCINRDRLATVRTIHLRLLSGHWWVRVKNLRWFTIY